MTNKKKILAILVLLFIFKPLYAQLDSNIMQKAFDYIINSNSVNEIASEQVRKKGKLEFYLSNELTSFAPRMFAEDIVEFQFTGIPDSFKSDIKSYLQNYPWIRNAGLITGLDTMNNREAADLIVFFSKSIWCGDYKLLSAEIFYIKNELIGDKSVLYHHKFYEGYTSNSSIILLFYFKNGEIVKTFHHQIAG